MEWLPQIVLMGTHFAIQENSNNRLLHQILLKKNTPFKHYFTSWLSIETVIQHYDATV